MRHPLKALALLGAAALLMPLASSAYRWIESEYDFGVMEEIDGKKGGMARMVNDADTAVWITRVRPSCGCTGVAWTEDMIAPGDTATVSFTYDPTGRPGRFEKSVKVWVGGATEPDIIRISGTVVGRLSSYRTRYPVQVGKAAISERVIDMGTIDYGKTRHQFISGYNASTDSIEPVVVKAARKGTLPVTVAVTPTKVPPGDIFSLTLFLDSNATDVYGLDTAERTLCIGNECIDLNISATINPPSMLLTSEQIENAPQAVATPSVIELKGMKADKKRSIEFRLENPGRTELKVLRIYSLDPRVKVKKYPSRLGAGKQARVSAEYVPSGEEKAGDVLSNMFEVITDDPVRPVQRIRYAGIFE